MDQNMQEGAQHEKMHWRCCWKPIVGGVIWVVAAVSLILAWVARDSVVLGYSGLGWYWNALVLAVLAIPLKQKGCKCGHGGGCNCGVNHNHM